MPDLWTPPGAGARLGGPLREQLETMLAERPDHPLHPTIRKLLEEDRPDPTAIERPQGDDEVWTVEQRTLETIITHRLIEGFYFGMTPLVAMLLADACLTFLALPEIDGEPDATDPTGEFGPFAEGSGEDAAGEFAYLGELRAAGWHLDRVFYDFLRKHELDS